MVNKLPNECKRGNKNMTFADCELTILRSAVDKIQNKTGKRLLHKTDVQRIIEIVEEFLKKKKRICYGGTAINNILPEDKQFYDKSIELPDYDFFSPTPLKDAKELANIYFKDGFTEVEAKSGVHGGTFKVFVNFIPVADLTFMPSPLFKKLFGESKKIGGIYYASPDYLRMSMYLELSRPEGDTSRWEKVLKRLLLLNTQYPLQSRHCRDHEVQRMFDNPGGFEEKELFYLVRDALVDEGVVFFGGYANRLYLRHHKAFGKYQSLKTPDFEVLANHPKEVAEMVKKTLEKHEYTNVSVVKIKGVGEIVPEAYQVRWGEERLVTIFRPLGCHSYNVKHLRENSVKIATIDTMLSFYLAFLFASGQEFDSERYRCMSEYLFQVQRENRLTQRGILKRFSINCYGDQPTLEKMRREKSEKYEQLKNKKGSKEYEWYFLRYVPAEREYYKQKKKMSRKRKTRRKKRSRRRRPWRPRRRRRHTKTRRKSFSGSIPGQQS